MTFWKHPVFKKKSTTATYIYIHFKRLRKPTSFGGRGTLKSTLQCIFSQMNLAIVLGEMECWWLMPCSLSLWCICGLVEVQEQPVLFCACSGRMCNAINSGNEFVPSAFWNGNRRFGGEESLWGASLLTKLLLEGSWVGDWEGAGDRGWEEKAGEDLGC